MKLSPEAEAEISFFEQMSREMEMLGTAHQFEFLHQDLLANKPELTNEKVADRLELIARSFIRDIQDQWFYRVTANKRPLLGGDFGPEVNSAFRSAAADIREANSCYALERNTAAIFHSMRCAEIGLRALARERRVKTKAPLAWQQWQSVIQDLAKQIDTDSQTFAKGPRKDAFLEFYKGALREFEGFKDEFRNHVSHARESYGEDAALRVLRDVRALMQRLTKAGLTEQGKRISWPRK